MLIYFTDVGRTQFTPGEVYYPRGISSLSSRPMEAPVKSKSKRSAVDEEPDQEDPPKEKATLKASSNKKPKMSKNPADSEESKMLEGIVDGTGLPASEAEAIAAAEVSNRNNCFATFCDMPELSTDQLPFWITDPPQATPC